MQTYVLLTRNTNESILDPTEFQKINDRIGERLRSECPEVRWISNYTVLGPYDHVDIFEAPDNEVAARVALVVRAVAHAHTEVWPAVTWERFKEISEKVA